MHGVSATPMVLCDDKGNSLVLDTVSNAWTDGWRAGTVEMALGAPRLLFDERETASVPWCAHALALRPARPNLA